GGDAPGAGAAGADGALAARLAAVGGADLIVTDPAERAFFSQDCYERGATAAVVARPRSAEHVAGLVKAACAAGASVHVRGGGMSYTRAFLPEAAGAVVLDMSGLDRIRAVAAEDGYVTVEAGCTWKALDEALAPHGVRAVFWGPFSGRRATVGGSMSQGAATFGSGQTGTSAPAALGFEIVTSDGEIIRTGMDGQPGHAPFFRPYGPDLTGLFTADAGALGVKTAVTLALEPRPKAVGGVSFVFASFAAMAAAMREAGATGLASELISMDGALAGVHAGEPDLWEDLKKLWAIAGSAHNPIRGVARGARAALAGRRVFREAAYAAHFIAEGASERLLEAKLDMLRAAGAAHGAEIPNAAIGVIRAEPFPDLPVTHADGRRMLPIHGLLANSQVEPFHRAYTEYIDGLSTRMAAAKVEVAHAFSGLGRHCFLYEPIWYWEDVLEAYHERMSPPPVLAAMPRHPANRAGRALVEEMRRDVIDLLYRFGAGHLQIGRAYPFMRERDGGAARLLGAVKRACDPEHRMNPGALGLAPEPTGER
ncbi:MAG: FAD-binding oxidoreductase, partial [Caulobacterales bacterium]|nr:FAD-binding oxidoreductase [Caulobacterales bacterium]